MSTLADRVRGVLQGTLGTPRLGIGPSVHQPDVPAAGLQPEAVDRPTAGNDQPLPGASGFSRTGEASLESVLGGACRQSGGAACFVVDWRRAASSPHGHTTVGVLANRLREAADDVPLLAGFPFRAPLFFFDLETTGLSGGAGTYAFLVGCGWFDEDDAFVTRQFMLVRLADERALLTSVAAELSRAGALVSFNGKSFDRPLIETRYLYHRLAWAGATLPHLDMLHVARRFWKRADGSGANAAWRVAGESGCSLAALERQLLGHRRHGDVPGIEIPQRYFHFIRSGDARPLAPVFEHNRLDLLSLAALTARVLRLVKDGEEHTSAAREALALGHLFAKAGLPARARTAYLRAAAIAEATSMTGIKVDALRALAVAARRSGDHEEAAGFWRRVLDVRDCPLSIARQASEALAIHFEHRVGDLPAAKVFALGGLKDGPGPDESVRHRIARIERKILAEAATRRHADASLFNSMSTPRPVIRGTS